MSRLGTLGLAHFVDRLEQSSRLEQAGDTVRPWIERVVGEGKRRDMLTGRWLGHPVHPGGVLVPLSCWFGAGVLDLVGGEAGRDGARRLLALGVIGSLPAAATGSADWLDTRGAEQRVGSAHALLNNTATAMFAASWALRCVGRDRRARVVSLGATTLLGVAGYLGGHLTYHRGVGVNTTAFQAGPEDWTRLALPEQIAPGKPVAAVAGEVALVVARPSEGEGLAVLEDRCTHRGGPLHDGELQGDCIVCPWHGTRFNTRTGAVVAGPASIPQPTYEIRRRNDLVEIRRTEPGTLRRNPITAGEIESPKPLG